MRKYLIVVLVMVFINPYTSLAQINLVPNSGFEDTVDCSLSGLGAIAFNTCLNWYTCRGNPDYWTPCSPSFAIPNTVAGWRYAHSVDKMVGIVTYGTQNLFQGLYREILGVDLIQPTISGQRYYFSMFINQGFVSLNAAAVLLATNKIGVKLTNSNYSQGAPAPIDNNSDYVDTVFHNDTLNWTKISGSFVSNGSFNKLMIGNFYDDSNTDTLNLYNNGTPYQYALAYYFIDDICLSTDSMFVATWTGVETISQRPSIYKVYPNPASSYLTIEIDGCTPGKCIMELYSIDGRTLFSKEKQLMNSKLELDLRDYPAGMYILNIKTNNKIDVIKVMKE